MKQYLDSYKTFFHEAGKVHAWEMANLKGGF